MDPDLRVGTSSGVGVACFLERLSLICRNLTLVYIALDITVLMAPIVIIKESKRLGKTLSQSQFPVIQYLPVSKGEQGKQPSNSGVLYVLRIESSLQRLCKWTGQPSHANGNYCSVKALTQLSRLVSCMKSVALERKESNM